MGMAEHEPSKVWKKNRGVLKMSKKQLHDFASTKGLGGIKRKEEDEEGH